jgi:hypothetical protein
MVSEKGEKMRKPTVWILSIMTLCLFVGFALAFASERFSDNGDGTVTDHLLGVMWGKVGSNTLSLSACR